MNIFCAIMIYLAIILSFNKDDKITKYLLFGAFTSTCFTNQHSSALLLAVGIPWALYEWIFKKA